MRRLLFFAAALALPMMAGCDDRRPPDSPPPSGGGDTITGRERIGWSQAAGSQGDVALYQFALYVDGSRRVLQGANCTGSTSPFDCSAPLPSLTNGQHSLELAAFVTAADGSMRESPRGAALQVSVAGLTAPPEPAQVEGGPLVSSDGMRLQATILARDLVDPVDLAPAADGRVFVAEQGGRLRIIAGTDGAPRGIGADVLPGPGDGAAMNVASLALPRDFAATRQLFVAAVIMDGDRPMLRITRVRERDGALLQAAVVAQQPVPAADIAVSMRIGPDGMLYVGVGAGPDGGEAQSLSAPAGKILRLTVDGRTPDDNPWPSPIYSRGHRDPRGLAWSIASRMLYEVERDERGDEVNAISAGGNYGWPSAGRALQRAGMTFPAVTLPQGTEPSGAAIVNRDGSPLQGDLIVSALAGADLIRIRFGAQGPGRVQGRLLQGRFGRVAQVAAGDDGALYFVTANRDTWGPGTDLLVRLEPIGE